MTRKTVDVREGVVDERLSRLLRHVIRPGRYVGGEFNVRSKPLSHPLVVLSYPDVYEIGVSNPALQILYAGLNDRTDVAAERAYCPWPDMAGLMRRTGLPLWTLESRRPVREAVLWGFTLPHELTFTNVLEMLDLAHVPILAAERGEGDPVVLGGGPAVADPLPLAPFVDAFYIGEVEPRLEEIAAAAGRSDRAARLRALAAIPGVWVPGAAAGPVRRQVFTGFADSAPVTRPLVPVLEAVHDRAVVEVMRGCTAGCRFCQAGTWYRPVRERPVDTVVAAAERLLRETGCDEVALSSLSSCDYSGVVEAVAAIREVKPGVRVSLPSLRVDSAAVRLAALGTDQRGSITLAPEAADEGLRRAINKGVADRELQEAAAAVFKAGYTGLKLYFMIGLPGETDADVRKIAALAAATARQARSIAGGRARLSVSVSTFIPKAATPFAPERFAGVESVRRRQRLLRDAWPRGVRLATHDVAASLVEAALARGGPRSADLLHEAWRRGARFDSWSEHFLLDAWRQAAEALHLDLEDMATAPPASSPADPLVDEGFLTRERERASARLRTPDCREGSCSRCGVCDGPVRMDLRPPPPATASRRPDARAGGDSPAVVHSAAVRVLVRFARGEPGRYLSHLDTVRALQRTFARAGVPLMMSQGMRPKPRLAVGLPLPVGSTGRDELAVADLAIMEVRSAGRVDEEYSAGDGIWLEMLRAAAPPGIEVLGLQCCPPHLRLRPELAMYEWSLPASAAVVARAVRRVLAREAAPVLRTSPKGMRTVDVREAVERSLVLPEGRGCALRFVARYGADGAVRPAEVLQAVMAEVTPAGLAEEVAGGARLARLTVKYHGLAASEPLKEWLENHEKKQETPGRR